MILYFCANIEKNSAVLIDDEFHHCCKVLRKKEGDKINITNGNGKTATVIIKNIKKKEAHLEVIESHSEDDNNQKINLAIAPPKNRARWEWLIEKTVEIGVDNIIPIISHHSERNKINHERSEKIMRSAALQSLRVYHPKLSPSIRFEKLLESQLLSSSDNYIAHYDPKNISLSKCKPSNNNALILIGPEGDFSEKELQLCAEVKFTEVNISQNRLRTETAAIVALTQLMEI